MHSFSFALINLGFKQKYLHLHLFQKQGANVPQVGLELSGQSLFCAHKCLFCDCVNKHTKDNDDRGKRGNIEFWSLKFSKKCPKGKHARGNAI